MKQLIYNACAILTVCLSGCSMVEIKEDFAGEKPVALGVTNTSLVTKSIYTGTGTETDPYILNKVAVGVTRANNTSWYDTKLTKQLFKTEMKGSDLAWVTEGDTLYLNDTEVTVYAWAPSDLDATFASGNPPKLEGLTFKAAQTCKFTENADKATDWDIDQTDYLWSVPVTKINKINSSAALEMKHALVKLSFRMMRADGYSDPGERDYVTEVKLIFKSDGGKSGFAAGGSLDLFTGVLTASESGRLANITLTPSTFLLMAPYKGSGGVPDFDAVAPQAFGLVAPFGTADRGKMDVAVKVGTLSGTTYDRTYTTTAQTALDWTAGNHYKYTILLTEKALTISSVTIASWTDQAKAPVEAE